MHFSTRPYWDKEKNLSNSFTIGNSMGRILISYKGISTNETLTAAHLPINMNIDLYDKPVTETLTMDRDKLNAAYKRDFYSNKLDRIINDCLELSLFLAKNELKENSCRNHINFLLLYLSLNAKKLENFGVNIVPVDNCSFVYQKQENGEYIESKVKHAILIEILQSGKFALLHKNRNSYDTPSLSKFECNDAAQHTYIFYSDSIKGIVENYFSITHIIDIPSQIDYSILEVETDGNTSKYVRNEDKDSTLKALNYELSTEHFDRPYIRATKSYPQIAVCEFPYRLTVSNINPKIEAIIISPVKKSNYITFDKFDEETVLKNIIEDASFERLIDFTYYNQNKTKQYSKDDIRQSYVDLIKDFYQYVKQKSQENI